MNRISALLIVSTTLALPVAAATDNVCWNRDTERLDFFTNPPTRGDNNFFSFTVSGTANVTMIYPGSASMKQLPVSLYELKDPTVSGTPTVAVLAPNGQGCQNSFLNNLDYFMPTTVDPPAASASYSGSYDFRKRYPEPETTYAGGGGLALNFEKAAYVDTRTGSTPPAQDGGNAYRYLLWPANSTGTPESIDTACTTATTGTGYVANDTDDCRLCVRTKGYWINYKITDHADNSPSAMVVKGNWLNYYPPKWAILRLAYKRLVNGPLLNSLREGIGTQNDAQGWYRTQKMLPQSCTGQGRPNQRIGSVDMVTYTSTANPLAEMLFNVAWSVSSIDSTPPSTWSFFTNQNTHPSSEQGVSGETNKKAGFCPGCNAGFSVLLSDGRGIDGWANCDGAANVAANGYCRVAGAAYDSHNACSGPNGSGQIGLGMGTEKDGDDYLDPNMSNGAASLISGATATYRATGAGVCANDFLPSVAAWMFATNLGGQPGTNLRLYTVGVGDNYFGEMQTLRVAADAGHGLFLSAVNFGQLERNIEQVFKDIISKATSFSVAAITTVQTRGTTFAFIPRFRPLGGSQWEGRLYRFRLFNEFAAGCSIADLTGNDGGPVKNSVNPNGNSSCNDLYLMDADGGFVAEDDGGSFVLLDNSQAYGDAGWPLKSPKAQATPIWEAATLLETRMNGVISGASGSARAILVAPMDGGIPSPGASLVAFNDYSSANVATMTDYMKLSGVNSDFCVGMASTSRHAYASEQECGTDLIKFMEGRDVLRQNFDGGVVRPNILGDIFHSSPILVTPPVPIFLCETGIITQCVRTLYTEDPSVPYTPNSRSAYTSYYNNKLSRQELIVVGANDGMLHAFQAGNYQADAGTFDEGTGQEVWAFIPPDLVPKLQRYALSANHPILLDGSPWVRDIWKDGSGASTADRRKQADEFHTIAIVGEREGGRYYTAIDVTDTSSNPKYLWTWPPPGSNYAMAAGESWNDTTPNPAPIGPILMQDDSGPISISVGGSAVKASERWVVAFGGGFDPNYIRGRAVYVLDAWDGTLLYKFSRYDTASSSDPRYLLGSVLAPVSMIDSNYDNFFDMAVLGDTDGQLWTIDMLNPGTLSSGLVTNWYGGLTFQQFKGDSLAKRAPFTTMTGARVFESSAISDSRGGNVRVYLGSGDRDQIKVRDTDSVDGGTCALDNLRGCIRNNCTVDVNQVTYQIGDGGTSESMTGRWKYTASGTSLTTNTFTLGSNTNTAGACNDWATTNIQYQVTCGSAAMADPNDGGTTIYNTMNCNFDGGSDAGQECLDSSGKPVDQPGVAFTSPTITNTRFYSIKIFDPPDYINRPRMTSSAAQMTYNLHTVTDSDLTDVTPSDAGMPTTSAGWYVQQTRDQNEKTVTAPLILGGCVAWNTEVPSVLFSGALPDGGSICNGGFIPADTAYLYQANDDTGGIQCGLTGSLTQLATSRYQQRSVTTTPQQPTPVVSLNAKTGQAGYSGISLEPGGIIPLQILVGSAAVRGDVSWLDVPRNLHNCRHAADGGTPMCTN
jgi:type IV pilus assembly protein PilY1